MIETETEKRLFPADYWLASPMRLSVNKKQQRKPVSRHWHNFFEIELILDGKGMQQFNGTAYPLRRGCVYLLTPTDEHAVQIEQELTMYNVMFSGEWLPPALAGELLSERQRIPTYLDEKQLMVMVTQFELLLQEYSKADTLQALFLQSVLQSILIMGVRAVNRLPIRNTPDPAQIAPIQRAVLYLQTHYTESPSLAETASVIGMNRTYFCEQFRCHTGRGYNEYLTMLKLDAAKHQLRAGRASVKNICLDSGFTSMSNFLRVFRENTGMSPLQYRKAGNK